MTNHAISNARAHLDEIVEAHARMLELVENDRFDDLDNFLDQVRERALAVEVRSGWAPVGDTLEPVEFRIMLTTGGPACAVFGELDERGVPDPSTVSIQWQDWGTPWTELSLYDGRRTPSDSDRLDEIKRAQGALAWFADLFNYDV